MEISIYIGGYYTMNTFKKLILATLILGVGTQAINAHPWSTRALAAATVAGLGLGAAEYFGFTKVTKTVLEKCANAKNWVSDLAYHKIPNSITNALFGSYIKQINNKHDALVQVTMEHLATQKKFEKSEADRKDAHERAIRLTQQIVAKNVTLKELLKEQNRKEGVMRGTIAGINGRSGVLETEKRAILVQNSRLQDEIAAQKQMIADLQNTILNLQAQLPQPAEASAPSDVETSESSVAATDADEIKFEEVQQPELNTYRK